MVQPLSAAFCVSCGRQFKTTAPHRPAPPDRTVLVQSQPPPEPPQPPRFGRLIHRPAGQHSILAAVALGLFCIPGAGQFYNRQLEKGALFLLVSLALLIVAVNEYLSGEFSLTLEPMRLLNFAVWVVATADAGLIAARLYRGEAVTEWRFF